MRNVEMDGHVNRFTYCIFGENLCVFHFIFRKPLFAFRNNDITICCHRSSSDAITYYTYTITIQARWRTFQRSNLSILYYIVSFQKIIREKVL